jgi:hypothetical protein
MTTNDHDWHAKWYVIPEFPGYAMSMQLEVLSLPGSVRCKGGATRQKPPKILKPSAGRVYLCKEGRRERFHVRRELFPRVFPHLHEKMRYEARQRPQTLCKHGHALIEPVVPLRRLSKPPRVAYWGTGNRICLYCSELPDTFDSGSYSLEFGTAGMSDYSPLPAAPQPRRMQGDLAELDWLERGFIISDRPW